jgi:hypothetical protein
MYFLQVTEYAYISVIPILKNRITNIIIDLLIHVDVVRISINVVQSV